VVAWDADAVTRKSTVLRSNITVNFLKNGSPIGDGTDTRNGNAEWVDFSTGSSGSYSLQITNVAYKVPNPATANCTNTPGQKVFWAMIAYED
jgi:hypothetical protein